MEFFYFLQSELLDEETDGEDFTCDFTEAINTSTSLEEISAALICLFFATNMNKTQFNITLDLVSKLSHIILPKSFNACADLLMKTCNQKLNAFQKELFCNNCESIKSKEMGRICTSVNNGLPCNQR